MIAEKGIGLAAIQIGVPKRIIVMDISWFPDNLTLYFFEGLIFETIGNQLGEQIPNLVDEYANKVMGKWPEG